MPETEQEKVKKKAEPFRLRVIYIYTALIALVFSFLLISAAVRMTSSLDAMHETTDAYIQNQQTASEMQADADRLTEQVRAFAVTGERRYLDAYFAQLETAVSADASAGLSETQADEDAACLAEADRLSAALRETDLYAMRLTIGANGEQLDSCPSVLQTIELAPEDAALSPDEMHDKAVRLLFDDEYQARREAFGRCISQYLRAMAERIRAEQADSSGQMHALLIRQNIFTAIFLLILSFLVSISYIFFIRPLKTYIDSIKEKTYLPMTGAHELQFLAKTYNSIFKQTLADERKLRHDATHDALTGLYNRQIFEELRGNGSAEEYTMWHLDLDFFKRINDTYGHDVGDRVLQRTANILRANFRSNDYVCRVGGEEFAVVMQHVGPALRDMIIQKAQAINEKLLHPEDDLPPCTLSIGIAFGEPGLSMDELYVNADTAMYYVKRHGRGSWAFFDELDEE